MSAAPRPAAPEIRALERHRALQQADRRAHGDADEDHDLVCCTHRARPLGWRNVTRAFKRHLVAAGPREIRFHDPRHTNATLVLTAGIHPKVVQERLGHSDIAITLNIYSHVMPTLGRDAAQRLHEALDGGDGGDVEDAGDEDATAPSDDSPAR
ncbi:MAG TPA: tyrosine-type recombinase/integrase [Thermomicrobiales bacterium]|nr:tyrosine-type recombinase/integrase [Thermomicrobiales bacterium]